MHLVLTCALLIACGGAQREDDARPEPGLRLERKGDL